MPVLLAGGGVWGCGAGPGREPVSVWEPSDVPDIGRGPGSDDRSDAGQIQPHPLSQTRHLIDHLGDGSICVIV